MFYIYSVMIVLFFFFFQAEDGIRDAQESRGLGDVYKRQEEVYERSTGIEAASNQQAEELVGLAEMVAGGAERVHAENQTLTREMRSLRDERRLALEVLLAEDPAISFLRLSFSQSGAEWKPLMQLRTQLSCLESKHQELVARNAELSEVLERASSDWMTERVRLEATAETNSRERSEVLAVLGGARAGGDANLGDEWLPLLRLVEREGASEERCKKLERELVGSRERLTRLESLVRSAKSAQSAALWRAWEDLSLIHI
eukprot:TRINITY_DN54638_c0_g2_i1.p1 TRINITY_DN54638_c0_g2~~TRINITY_DN54638_c0_g2_i1.p1  ORF type:complete len:259 (-),score=94.31 TRINITY_DN54638_c0_g2_i1:85-861(-)